MLKPGVCSRELCCWSFQQLGVGSDCADDVATEAEVVDLLVCFTVIAAKSNRRDIIFNPFPLVLQDESNKIFDPDNKDHDLVVSTLNKFPSVMEMTQEKDFYSLKERLDYLDPYCFPLLQWIITSNRSHIVLIPKDRRIRSMVTPHQYLLLSAPPEKEKIFRENKKQYGSCFAFHGSSSENWHSILRRGLINASGTKLQVNGAAYGNGIYLSPEAGTSFGYSKMNGYTTTTPNKTTNSTNVFLNSDNINCIAICEVIDKDIRKSGAIWVQPDENYVVTRFFCVYIGNDPGDAKRCSTSQPNFVKELEEALNYYNY